jgi:hypothetical protein
LVRVFESEEAFVSGAIDFVADFLVVAAFDDGCPGPFRERVARVGNLDEVTASNVAVPAEEFVTGWDNEEFGGLIDAGWLGSEWKSRDYEEEKNRKMFHIRSMERLT